MDNAPQLPHRPAPPVGTEWNTEFRRIQLKITKNTTIITDGLVPVTVKEGGFGGGEVVAGGLGRVGREGHLQQPAGGCCR